MFWFHTIIGKKMFCVLGKTIKSIALFHQEVGSINLDIKLGHI